MHMTITFNQENSAWSTYNQTQQNYSSNLSSLLCFTCTALGRCVKYEHGGIQADIEKKFKENWNAETR